MDTCPNCHRPLISHASARCNWCGEEIKDEAYQKEAAEQRVAFRRYEAERIALEAARTAAMGSMLNSNGYPVGFPGNPLGAFSPLNQSWQGRMRWEAAYQAQQAPGVQVEAPWQPAGPQGPAQGQNPDAQAPADTAPADSQGEVRSVCDHLEL